MKYYKQGDECTFEPGQEEYELLEALANKLMELSPNGFKYWVDDVYLDYGSKWMWTTVISEDTISPYFQSTYQALSPAEWLALMNGEDITEIAEHVLSDKYCPDKIKSSKSIRKGTYVKSDVNSYSYTGGGFADDTIILAKYSDDDGYVELGKDLSTCYVTSQSFIGDHDFYREYPMSDIDIAIRDFNQEIKYFGGQRVLRRSAVEFELNKYGKSLNDYISSATNICNIAGKPVFGDDDFEEDDFSETYTVYGYYGRNFTGLSDSEDFDNLSQAEDYVWELLQNGAYVELVGPDSTRRFSPDKLDESLGENGEVYDITDAEIIW